MLSQRWIAVSLLAFAAFGVHADDTENDPDDPTKRLFTDAHNDSTRIEQLVDQAQRRSERKPRGSLSSLGRQANPNSDFAREAAALRAGPQLLEYADLSQRIGQRVTITTFEAAKHIGTVEAVNNTGVTLLIRSRSGYATFRILKQRIREIEGY